MSYQIKTIQYGIYIDIINYQEYSDLLDDLEAIECLPTIEVKWIKNNGTYIDIEKCFKDMHVDELRN